MARAWFFLVLLNSSSFSATRLSISCLTWASSRWARSTLFSSISKVASASSKAACSSSFSVSNLRHPHRDQELPWREVHQEGQDGPRRRCREQQGPEGRVDRVRQQHRRRLPVCCTHPAVHHCQEQGHQKVP